MSDTVRWEPIPPGEAVDYDMTIGSSSELRVSTELGEMVVEFDDDVRLTEPVAAPEPDWSQEPPTEPGDWWVWLPGHRPILATLRQAPSGDITVLRDNRIIGTTSSMRGHAWYMPATVPSPPTGEVGP